MKVGIFTPYLDTLTGGEKYILTLAKCLAKKNEVSLFWDDVTILGRAEKKFSFELSLIKLTQNIFSPKVSLITRLQESRKYDAIVYLSDGSIPITLAKKLYIHFQFPVEWVNANSFLNKLKFARVYNTFCNSQFTKKYIDRKFHTDSIVIYPPIEIQKDYKQKKENIILTVGRYGYLPNGSNFKKLDIMISIFKKMIDEGVKHWEFILCVSFFDRDKEKVEEIKKTARGYPITFVENATSKELQLYYQRAKIYWHASGFGEDIEVHPDYAEHFGMTTVEAMSYGVIPVVINLGGQTEIVTEERNGLLWNTEKELIAKTKLVMSNPGLQNTLSKGAKQRAKDFSVEKFYQSVERLIE